VVVANFAAGLLIGVLLGLALAPVVRAWVAWRTVEETRLSVKTSDVRAPIDR
jgi:hypothetical protein